MNSIAASLSFIHVVYFSLVLDVEEPEVVYDVVEKKTSTRPRSRIPWVVVEKNTTRRREGAVDVSSSERPQWELQRMPPVTIT